MSTLIINSASATDTPLFKTLPLGGEEEHGWSAVGFRLFEYRLDGGVLEIQLRNPHKKVEGGVAGLFSYPTDLQLREIEKTSTLQDAGLAAAALMGGDFAVWSGLQKNPAFSRGVSVFRSVESFRQSEEMAVVEIDLNDEKTLRHMAEWIENQTGGAGGSG